MIRLFSSVAVVQLLALVALILSVISAPITRFRQVASLTIVMLTTL